VNHSVAMAQVTRSVEWNSKITEIKLIIKKIMKREIRSFQKIAEIKKQVYKSQIIYKINELSLADVKKIKEEPPIAQKGRKQGV